MRRRCPGYLALACAFLLTPAAGADEPATIALLAPFSGIDGGFGQQLRMGAQQAAADIDAAGGVLGRQLRVVNRDDGNDVEKARQAAEAIVSDHTDFVIGDFSSLATGVTAPVFAAAKVLQITPSALSKSLAERAFPTLFRMSGRDDRQGELAARYLLSRHITRIAILYDGEIGNEEQAASFRAVLKKAGVRDVYEGQLETSQSVPALASRLKSSGAQVAFVAAGPSIAGQLARRMREGNGHVLLMATDAIASQDFAAAAGNAADGTMMIFPQDPKTRPAAQDLLKRFRARGIEPGAYVFYAYAAVQVVQQGIAAAHSLEVDRIATVLHSGMQLHTVLGDISFDETGDLRSSDYTIYVWHKGATGRMSIDEQIRS